MANGVNGSWSDGTFAESCLAYLTGDETHAPATTNGGYTIKPAQTTYSVTCDMTGGGWTRFDFMVSGHAWWPGDNRDVYTQRVQSAYMKMYQEIANVSTLQKLIGVTGNSEAGGDRYSFHTQSNALVANTADYYSGSFGAKDIQLTVAGDWTAAFGFTRFRTDSSVQNGAGAVIPENSWFK